MNPPSSRPSTLRAETIVSANNTGRQVPDARSRQSCFRLVSPARSGGRCRAPPNHEFRLHHGGAYALAVLNGAEHKVHAAPPQLLEVLAHRGERRSEIA